MPTIIKEDTLKLVDCFGRPSVTLDFIDPENPLILINPEVGKTYEATVFLKNTSEHLCQFIRLSHSYEDVKIEPSYIEFLKPNGMVEIKITWKPFKTEHITEKVKDGKVSINFTPSCKVVVEQ